MIFSAYFLWNTISGFLFIYEELITDVPKYIIYLHIQSLTNTVDVSQLQDQGSFRYCYITKIPKTMDQKIVMKINRIFLDLCRLRKGIYISRTIGKKLIQMPLREDGLKNTL